MVFTIFDWIVLAAYLLLSLFIGLWVSRGNKNLKEYMFGGGSIPWVAVGISLIATSVSATTFLGAPADVYGDNMTFLMFQIGALLSIVVVGFVFIPRFRTSGINSAYELFEVRFGSKAVRRLAAVFYSLHLLLRTGILLYAPSLVLAQILHIDLKLAIVVSAAVAIFYTWFGGIRAVIWTDVMQFCVFFGGGVLVLVLISNAVGGFGEMAALASEAGKTKWWDASMDISNARTLVSAGFAYAILEIAIRGCDQQFVQRYLSCKDVKAANRSSILSMVLGCFVSILFYWVGAALYVYYQKVQVAVLPENVGQNDVFPYFIVNGLPVGVTGLIVAAICAAAMSSLSSSINSLSNTSERDFLGWDESKGMGGLKRAKIWTVVWGVLGVFFALFAATQQGSLLKNALFFTGLFTGPLLGMFLLAFFVKELKSWQVIVAVICGMASLVLVQGIPAFGVPAVLGGIFSWPWMPFISMTTTVLVAVVLKFVKKEISKKECPMQNKVSYVVIIVLAFVCLILSMRMGQDGSAAQSNTLASVPSVSQEDQGLSGGVSVSSEESKNFLADEYVTSFKMVEKSKNKDIAYKRLNESREKVLELLKKHSVGPQEYELVSTTLENDWEYAKGKRIFLGYVASQMVKVVSHSKQESDSLEFDLASFAFVDNVSTLSRLKNAEALEVDVIKSACKKASRLAEVNAQSVGAKVGKVISVEGSSEVEKLSSSDSVEVSASVSATLSLDGVENSGKSYVHVSQSESKKFLADKFVVTANIVFDGIDKEALFKQMGVRRADVAQMAKDLGVAESEIEAQSMTLRKKQKYEFYGNESSKDAFRATQKVSVNFTSKDAAAAFLDGIVGLENVNVLNVAPVLKNEDSLRVQVTNIVGKKAMARAKAIAEGFDGSLGKVVAVSNKRDYEFGSTLLGGRANNGLSLGKARMKSMPAYDIMMASSSSESKMNIADSVTVSAFLTVMAEIK